MLCISLHNIKLPFLEAKMVKYGQFHTVQPNLMPDNKQQMPTPHHEGKQNKQSTEGPALSSARSQCRWCECASVRMNVRKSV